MATVEHTDAENAILKRRRRRQRKKFDVTKVVPLWAHPDVLYWAPTWATIRDCILGEQQIKLKEDEYLPPLDEQSKGEYDSYLDRSVFFNMTGRTVSALTGMVFQKHAKIAGLPDKEKKPFRAPTRTGISFEAFLKQVVQEVLALGRVGVLLDMDAKGNNVPYFVHYTAEHILDWSLTEIEGRLTPTEIVLRELKEQPRVFGQARMGVVVYRVLRLEPDAVFNWVYRQYVYETTAMSTDLASIKPTVFTPTRRGKPFDRIPFRFIGALSNTADIDRAPMADIAALNLAHYKAYAQLEHGRYYTAMPVYYAMTPNGQPGDYRLGASVVWEVGIGEKPGVIEFTGAGLKYLESSCAQKEDQIASLGGRLMGGKDRSVAESDNEVKLKEGNERAILLNAVMGVNEAMTELLQLWLWWRDYEADTFDAATVELNTQFLMDTLGARELRAIYAMYKDGVVPVTVLHYYLQMAEAIPEWMDADEFKILLDSEAEFPNQPDVLARMKGFPSAAEMLNAGLKEREVAAKEKTAEAQMKSAEVKEGELELEREIVEDPNLPTPAPAPLPAPGAPGPSAAKKGAGKPVNKAAAVPKIKPGTAK